MKAWRGWRLDCLSLLCQRQDVSSCIVHAMMFKSKASIHRLSILGCGLGMVLWLAGCASGPSPGRPGPGTISPGKDGPPDHPPADLTQVPDAVPKVELIVPSGPNKPYVVEGQAYEPLASDVTFKQRGLASWYGTKFHGRRTASGEVYSMYGMTAAHRTLPIPSYARVRSVATGKSVIVRVNDRGPFHSSRVMDLSYTAAAKLDVLGRGTVEVEVERITFDQIRSGLWRMPNDPAVALAAVSDTSPAQPAPSSSDAIYALASRLEDARPQPVPSQAEPVVASLPPAQASAMGRRDVAVTQSKPGAAPPSPVPAASVPAETRELPGAPAAAPALAPPRLAQEVQGRAYTSTAKGYWVQLAAFSKKAGVDTFQQRVAQDISQLASLLAVFNEGGLYKLQVGPYERRDEAQSVAQRIRDALHLVPMVVDRR